MSSYNYNLGLWFDEIASQNGHKEAIIFPNETSIKFAELNSNANKLANYLLNNGVKKYDVVSIAGVKKIHTYEAFLACLKLGVTYSFFDPESPLERLEKILHQCNPVAVIGYFNEVEAVLDHAKWNQLDFSSTEFNSAFENCSDKPATDSTVEGSCAAYIMFTSGSTGFPKGAVMTHANVINFIQWGKKTFSIAPTDRHTNVNPLYFDNSVFDLYCSMFNGAALVPITKNETISPKILLNILSEIKCTTWFSVPSLLIYLQTSRAIIPDKWASVKKISFGGEGYPKAKLLNLYNALKHNTKIYNVYGPTECTCICSSYEVSDSDFNDLAGFLPLGQIAENFSYLIVDDSNKITNEKGDLLLGGPNVGLGYFNDPGRTAERFIQNPFHTNFRDIYYRTGDLVSYNKEDKKIYIYGRTDHQIKHMGYRIELEEIENAICQLPYISEAAAFVIDDIAGNKILSVYESAEEIDEKKIKEDLKKYIPSYMIPSELHRVERIAKNANGKTDRPSLKKMYQK